ncbi:DMT family transporter [Vibrio tritonius]|uniref:DMT family transporter n=1 Tax=Vibrio tritonius TaxID=1435069 RepID=UPI00315D214D
MTKLKYHLLLLGSTLIIAGSFISAQILASGVNPTSLALMRFILAAAILLPFVLINKSRRKAFAKVLPKGMAISFFYAAFFLIMFKSLQVTTTLNTGTLYTLVPFLTALASVFLFRDKIRTGTLFVYMISTVGTLWVISRGNIDTLLHLNLNQGDLLFLVGCFSMVGFSVSMKLLYKGEDMLVFVFSTLLSGATWMGLYMLFSGETPDYSGVTWNMSLHMVYLSVFSTLLTTWVMQIATVNLSPRQVSGYIYLNPVFVAIIAMITTNEILPSSVYPGIALSILATFSLQFLAAREKKTTVTC